IRVTFLIGHKTIILLSNLQEKLLRLKNHCSLIGPETKKEEKEIDKCKLLVCLETSQKQSLYNELRIEKKEFKYLIRENIARITIIITDGWKGYGFLKN